MSVDKHTKSKKAYLVSLKDKLKKHLNLQSISAKQLVRRWVNGFMAAGLSQEIESPPGGILDQWMQQVPLARAGAPAELFDTVVFLASENAGYISGQSLPVDGGYSA
jgi:NAD(P)-dependent dehydrogenase (short-subunit alcohol dehydrogenase family)